MTDLEVGKAVREILCRGNSAEVKMNKDREITVYEVEKKILKSDKNRI
ncbi:MAG: hypothetical protein NC321_16070 [Clostridium sp.]|nr:hypothetical protein [Lachnospiraceae bacterium]MCM1254335.1 hypothetical protein [Clostridium sp.]